jgi:xylulose-5-phosphate/fructose-6-phosphate phosphoketolase
MVNQHQKWYKMCLEIPWRNELPSLNILLSSHVWRQDHNGFTHQDPGFIGHLATKRPEIVRIYLPPDANCLLSVMHHCLKSRHYINVITAGKHASPQWLTVEESRQHCTQGISIWEWASNDKGCEPDIIMASAGDVPTLEALAAVSILRKNMPALKIRFVNVVDLMRMNRPDEHPHGMPDDEFDSIFTKNKPVVFAFHAYVHFMEKLICNRTNRNFLVKGYKEEGTISTAFDMTVMNEVDRYHLVIDACDFIENKCDSVDPTAKWTAPYLRQEMKRLLVQHKTYIHEFGVDMDEITGWKWNDQDE